MDLCFYWTDYLLIPTLELFNARYLHFAETTDKFNGKSKLVGDVQFKTPVTPEDLTAISPNITWVNQRGANMTVINFIERVGTESSNAVTRLGTPFPMRESSTPITPLTTTYPMRERTYSVKPLTK